MALKTIFSTTLLLLLSLAIPTHAQESAGPSVQMVNGTCLPELSLQINGVEPYGLLPQGAATGGGHSGIANRKLVATDPATGAKVERSFSFRDGESVVLAIIGDFQLVEPEPESETESGESEPEVRAEILALSNALDPSEKPHRLRILNGIPTSTATATVRESDLPALIVEPMQSASLSVAPAIFEVEIAIENETLLLSFDRSGIPPNLTVILFLRDQKPAYKVVNEWTPEYFRKLSAAEPTDQEPADQEP